MATTLTTGEAADKVVIDLPELADLLGVSVRHAAALNAAGKLPRPVELGRCRRFRVSEIHAWIEAGCPARNEWELMRKAASCATA